MYEHVRTPCARFTLTALLLLWPAQVFAQNSIEANGPANVEMYSATVLPWPAILTSLRPDGDAGAEVAAGADSDAVMPPVNVALQERQALGPPAVAAKSTAPNTSAEANEGGGLIHRLDPRSNEFTKVAAALAAVIGLLLLTRAVMRRAGGFMAAAGRPSGVLEILARYPVGRGQSLILLKVARRVVLLHQSGSSMTALSEMTDQHEVAALLARMESGANQRDAARFKKTLDEFAAMHDEASQATIGGSRKSLPLGDAELVDLTRKRWNPLGWAFRGKARS